MTLPAFPCTQCGLCCRNVHLAEQTQYLDRGDGACRHYSDTEKHCLIYETRPDICRVDRQYQMHYAQRFSWEAFVEVNVEVCKLLQDQGQAQDSAKRPELVFGSKDGVRTASGLESAE